MNNIHSAVDLMPQYIGSLTPNNGSIKWRGACFFDTEARIEFMGHGDRDQGGGVIYLSVCFLTAVCLYVDYVFVCTYRYIVKFSGELLG